MVFESREQCQKMGRFAGDANEQNLDRLTAVLAGDGARLVLPTGAT